MTVTYKPDPIPGPMRVAICQPYCGPVIAGASHGFHRPCGGRLTFPLYLPQLGYSSIPHNFNQHLQMALDVHDEGRCTHFAMIHADVIPYGPWLDLLAVEMLAHKLAVVSAVIALKSDEGKTSTAIGLAADRWGFARHVLIADRESMPVTFTGADVCGPGEVLLINTGLWLADLRHPFFRTWPGFDTHTRIVKDKDGRRECQFRPEDWEMGRDLHDAGVPYGATWKVIIEHEGTYKWANQAATISI